MTGPLQQVPLRLLAHGRTGDKGDRINISVICRDPSSYGFLAAELTAERVRALFGFRDVTAVVRYDLPGLAAFNFVLDGALDGGVNRSLFLDRHGKAMSSRLLDLELPVPAGLLAACLPAGAIPGLR